MENRFLYFKKKFPWFLPLKIDHHYHIRYNIFNQALLYVLIFAFHKFLTLLKIISHQNNYLFYFRILLSLAIINVKEIKNDVEIESSSNEVKTYWNFLFHLNYSLDLFFKMFHYRSIQKFSFRFVSYSLNLFDFNLFYDFHFHQNIYWDLFFECLKFKIIRIQPNLSLIKIYCALKDFIKQD